MKWKLLLFSVLFFSLLGGFISPTSASVSYSRTPSGTNITSPVSFNISIDNFEVDTGCSLTNNYWGIYVANEFDENYNYSEFIVKENTDHIFSINLPIGYSAWVVVFVCSIDGVEYTAVGNDIEGNGTSLVFTIIENITFLTANTFTGIIASVGFYSTALFNDFGDGGILELIVGISLGLMLISWTINKFKKPKQKKMF